MKTNESGLSIIREFEGCSLTAYLCPAGIPTIGFGHTAGVKLGDKITEEAAERLLLQDVAQAEKIVEREVRCILNENQYSALVSFVFNVGPGKTGVKSGFVYLKNGRPSTLLRRLNVGDYHGAADQFDEWVYAGGKTLLGLERRRKAEKELFKRPAVVK